MSPQDRPDAGAAPARAAEKVSRYLVISDKAYRGGPGVDVQLLYGTRTSKLMAVDRATADALRAGDVARIAPGWLPALREARIVVPAEHDELALVLGRNRHAAADRSAVQISLLPTSYCNMGCAYCGQEHTRGQLPGNHREQVRARVLRAIARPETRQLRIDWFGAEPMMGYAVIKDLAPHFVRAAAERGVGYTSYLVTNGSLLTAAKIGTLVRECGVTHFEITVDGPPAIHDEHRPLKNGRGSFWTIVDAVRAALDDPANDGVRFRFRTNVDVHNQDAIPQYVELMARLGFARPNVSFSVVPVHSWGNDVTALEVAKQDFAGRELQWLRLLQEHGLNCALLPHSPMAVVCPAATTAAEIISSTGQVFSCSEHPLVPQAERELALIPLSALGPDAPRPQGEFDGWNDEIERGESWCRGCVFMPTCGGACPKAWHEGHPPCPSYKFNVQGRLDLVAAGLGLGPAEGGVDGSVGSVASAGGVGAALDAAAAR